MIRIEFEDIIANDRHMVSCLWDEIGESVTLSNSPTTIVGRDTAAIQKSDPRRETRNF